MPMTFDQYGKCCYRCIYCFATFQKAVGVAKTNYLSNEVTKVDVEKVKRIFTEPNSSQFWPYVKNKMTMQWGGMADPFCPFEKKFGVGLELLRFFRKIDYPICFSTKGTWWLNDSRYTELFKDNPNWNVKVSIITLNESYARSIEIGVPTPKQRLDAIKKISDLNCGGATLRLRPFMIGISNPSHKELIKQAGENGATALSTEFFCMERRSNILKNRLHNVINKILSIDYIEYYKKYSYTQGYLRLNRNIKRQFIDEMEEACRLVSLDTNNKNNEKGMRFYVSDAHFKERCHNGSCCGLPESFNYSRGQFCEALVICKRNGTVTWGDITAKGEMDHLKGFLWRKAQGFNTGSAERRGKFQNHTMYDYMKWLWNNPKNGQSPYTMFEGVMKPVDKDEDGNIIYVYDKSRT